MKSIKYNFRNFVKSFFILALVMFLFSCEKSSSEEVFIGAQIDFLIKDIEGNDLLNSNNPNAIKS